MKLKLIIFSILGTLITISLVLGTFALFETNASGKSGLDVGKFVVKLNSVDIAGGTTKTFEVNGFNYEENDHIENGYIAPGRNGYFDLVLDATKSDVAVRYDISFDLTNDYEDNITYSVSSLDGSYTSQTGENTYSGIITLDDINDKKTVTLRIYLSWNNLTEYNEADTKLGTTEENKFKIPVTIHAYQYLGETI